MNAPREQYVAPYSEIDGACPPVYWPAMCRDEALAEWPSLHDWVTTLRTRFPHGLRLPECWFRHNDLVELLAALRDFERGSYSPRAHPTSALDWHRALREVETRAESWTKRFGCITAGRGHQPPPPPSAPPADWHEFIDADIAQRRDHTTSSRTEDASSPTPEPANGPSWTG